jgi:hypothetical protein
MSNLTLNIIEAVTQIFVRETAQRVRAEMQTTIDALEARLSRLEIESGAHDDARERVSESGMPLSDRQREQIESMIAESREDLSSEQEDEVRDMIDSAIAESERNSEKANDALDESDVTRMIEEAIESHEHQKDHFDSDDVEEIVSEKLGTEISDAITQHVQDEDHLKESDLESASAHALEENIDSTWMKDRVKNCVRDVVNGLTLTVQIG